MNEQDKAVDDKPAKPAKKAASAKSAKKAAAKPAKKTAAAKPAKKASVAKSAKKAAAKPAKKAAAKPAKKASASKSAKKAPAAQPPAKPEADEASAKSDEAKPARRSKKPQYILRIRLRGFDYKQVDSAAETIVRTVRHAGFNIRGPIPLPVSRERYDLLRSPHVFKDSREQIEIRTYHRLIDVLDPSKKTIDACAKIGLPAGIEANMKMI